jgi:tRNA threonylcarbamoyladenosine biosynthesis protein TsaB
MLNHFLIIDTSTSTLYVSLVKNQTILHETLEEGDKDHAIKLMPSIQEALKGVEPQTLDGIVVGIGPGSYTGVRMGVVVAKILAKEFNIPLYKISSLLLKSSSYEGEFASIIDARRDYVFGGIYNLDIDSVIILEDRYLMLEELKNKVNPDQIISTFKPDILKLNRKNLFVKVEDIDELTPNYLRKTQAENERNNS